MARGGTLVIAVAAALGITGLSAYGAQPTTGNPTAGKRVFLKQCSTCHMLKAAGSRSPPNLGPNLDEVRPTYRQALNCVTYGTGFMPAFGTKRLLNRKQIRDVATFVSRTTRPNKPPPPVLRCGPLPPPP